ncbi:hypothetical protein CBR_g23670 [Chara braunii]|uniref:Uncharacterized protein n=1 Tax=Chara braunii TaxID=69332 RepID=A0A388L4U1_CHABU|nr:hypothetical protein CBR_g23670 [Chara braunii]|eukprot:GBG77339.1 hypothetical protein CBR_g23670 [Chara braunii]
MRSGGTILAFCPHKVGGLGVLNGELGGVERGSVEDVIRGGWSGVVMEKAGLRGSGRRLVMGVEESIVVKHAREEVSKGHVGVVGEGGCKVFVATCLMWEMNAKSGMTVVGRWWRSERTYWTKRSVEPVWRRWQNCSRSGGGVLLEAGVEEGVVCAVEEGVICVVVEGGAAVVTTVMEGLSPSSVVTRSDMDDTVALMSSTEVWTVLSAWRTAERSEVAVLAGGCSPARLRAMLSTESVRVSDMLMEDAVMSGEEGVGRRSGSGNRTGNVRGSGKGGGMGRDQGGRGGRWHAAGEGMSGEGDPGWCRGWHRAATRTMGTAMVTWHDDDDSDDDDDVARRRRSRQ